MPILADTKKPDYAADDFGAFVIESGEITGTWTFVQDPLTGAGGGLSNASIWTGPTRVVPEPSIIALLGLGLVGLGFVRRRARS